MKAFPESRLGKWAVGLTLVWVLLLVIFFLFPLGMIIMVAITIDLVALVLSIMAIVKERTVLTYCSLILGVIFVLFLLTHSLFISD
jgi:hypothetical protein